MPPNFGQLADLVERARQAPPPVVSPPSPPPPARPAPAVRATASAPAESPSPEPQPNKPVLPLSETIAPDDFPIGWQLTKESWNFHRRFHRILRRPMHRGEYSYLLHQIREGHAEHLAENYWRVTLPDGRRTLMVHPVAADHHSAKGLAGPQQLAP